jgi:hypothetical protein
MQTNEIVLCLRTYALLYSDAVSDRAAASETLDGGEKFRPLRKENVQFTANKKSQRDGIKLDIYCVRITVFICKSDQLKLRK